MMISYHDLQIDIKRKITFKQTMNKILNIYTIY